MISRTIASAVITFVLFTVSVPSSRAQVAAPNTTHGKQPANALFEGAMDAMRNSRYAEARTLLETLINSNPDSDYVPRAKLALGDAWYAEGILKKAEVEYQDFVTFFPNRPEVAEAKLKIDSIQKKSKI
jgi:outer membrane protein assembly factor BamD